MYAGSLDRPSRARNSACDAGQKLPSPCPSTIALALAPLFTSPLLPPLLLPLLLLLLLLLPLLPLLPPLPRLPLPLPPLNAAQLPVHVVLAPTTTVLQVVRLQPAPSVSIPHHCEKPYGK